MSVHDHGYLPALRFRVLTPLFDAVVSGGAREGVFKKRLAKVLAHQRAARKSRELVAVARGGRARFVRIDRR